MIFRYADDWQFPAIPGTETYLIALHQFEYEFGSSTLDWTSCRNEKIPT